MGCRCGRSNGHCYRPLLSTVTRPREAQLSVVTLQDPTSTSTVSVVTTTTTTVIHAPAFRRLFLLLRIIIIIIVIVPHCRMNSVKTCFHTFLPHLHPQSSALRVIPPRVWRNSGGGRAILQSQRLIVIAAVPHRKKKRRGV